MRKAEEASPPHHSEGGSIALRGVHFLSDWAGASTAFGWHVDSSTIFYNIILVLCCLRIHCENRLGKWRDCMDI